MSVRARTTISLLSLTLAASVTAGCGQSPESPRAGNAAATPDAASETPSEAKQVTGDVRACLGVEAVLGHVASTASRWSPERQPFDKTIAARLRTSSEELAAQGPQAQNPKVREAVTGIASSFRSLSDAMADRNRRGVSASVLKTRASYKVLKSTCQLD